MRRHMLFAGAAVAVAASSIAGVLTPDVASSSPAPIIVLAGDSTVAGGVIAPWDRLDVRLGYRLCGATVVNRGVGGQALLRGTSVTNLASTWSSIIHAAPRPDVIVVGIGMNDLFDYAGDVPWSAAYISLVQQAQELGIRVLITEIPPVNTAHANIEPLRRSLNAWLTGYFGATVVVPYQALLGLPGGHIDPAYVMPDGIHPNGWGTIRMADAIAERLLALGWV